MVEGRGGSGAALQQQGRSSYRVADCEEQQGWRGLLLDTLAGTASAAGMYDRCSALAFHGLGTGCNCLLQVSVQCTQEHAAFNLQPFQLQSRKGVGTKGCTPVEVMVRALSLLASASSAVAVSA